MTLDKLDFPGTLMYHLRQMSMESAKDGFLVEFEDCVDLLGLFLWPYIVDAGREKDWNRIEDQGKEFDPGIDKPNYTKAKRFRIMEKMKLCMILMKENKLLIRQVDFNRSMIGPDAITPESPWGDNDE